ncbi:MAG: signal peptidase I [Phycisphaerae bacterium]
MESDNNPLLNNPGMAPVSRPPAEAAPKKGAPTMAVTAPAAARPTTGAPPPQSPANPNPGVRETLETVILALILAFTFRTFCVEAFVIPTGSMAPTLSGAHFRAVCPMCGYRFNVNADVDRQWMTLRDPQTGERESTLVRLANGELTNAYAIPAPDYSMCPNCHFEVPADALRGKPIRKRIYSTSNSSQTLHFPYTYNGDRILVMKYLYWFSPPQRWNIVVFREPMFGKQNFIKRLVGLPGNTVEIVNGDVFIDGKIAHKPVDVEKAMLQVVYNNDFYPIDAGQKRMNGNRWSNPWVGEPQKSAAGKWFTDGPVISFSTGKPNAVGHLAFMQRNSYLYNDLGYNANPYWNGHHIVGNLYLRTVWISHSPDSAVRMTLGPATNRFQVTLEHDGALKLYQWDGANNSYLPISPRHMSIFHASAALQTGKPYRLALSNTQHEARFWINGKLMVQYAAPWTLADALAVAQLRHTTGEQETPKIQIAVTGGCTLRHLLLMRDIYYTQMKIRFPYNSSIDPGGTRPGTGTMGHPITLKKGQYFMLGDNSNDSEDSRAWYRVEPVLRGMHLPMGVVPQRYILGRAFMVYWPAGFRPMRTINWAIIPNIGRMRFIR